MTIIKNSSNSLNESQIKSLEKEIDSTLPHDYRQFLLKYNSGYPEPDAFLLIDKSDGSSVDHFLGIDVSKYQSFDYFLETYKNRISRIFFPIAHDPGGNLILIGLCGEHRGKVFFWDHEKETDEPNSDISNMHLISNSFSDFLNSLYKIELE